MADKENETVAGFKFIKTDGGRVSVDTNTRKGRGDCVIRALAIATRTPYAEVAREIIERRINNHTDNAYDINHGSHPDIINEYLADRGWIHIKVKEKRARKFSTLGLSKSKTYILDTSRHVMAVVDGVFYDTWDSRFNRTDLRDDKWAKLSDDNEPPKSMRQISINGYWVKCDAPKPKGKQPELINGFGYKRTAAGRTGRVGTNDSILRALVSTDRMGRGYKWAIQGLCACRKESAKHLEDGARIKNYGDGTPRIVYTWWLEAMRWNYIDLGTQGKPVSELKLSPFRNYIVVLANDNNVAVVKGVFHDTTDSRLNATAYGYWSKGQES